LHFISKKAIKFSKPRLWRFKLIDELKARLQPQVWVCHLHRCQLVSFLQIKSRNQN